MWRNFGGEHHGFKFEDRPVPGRRQSEIGGWKRHAAPLFRPGRFATELAHRRRPSPRRKNESLLNGAFRWIRGLSGMSISRGRPRPRAPPSPQLKRKHAKRGNLRGKFAAQSPPRVDDRSSGTPHKGFTFVHALERGGMSVVVQVIKHKATGKLFVEKRVSLRNRAIAERAKAELNALKRLRGSHHPNLNQLIEHLWLSKNGYCSFVLTYCESGSIDKLVKMTRNAGSSVQEKFVWRVLVQAANGLAYIHWGILDATDASQRRRPGWDTLSHLDIKPQNLFIKHSDRNPHGIVVIGDFGCSVSLDDMQQGRVDPRVQECGTPAWYPPEGLIEVAGRGRTSYGPPTDIFMLGATCHTLCRLIDLPDRKALMTPVPKKIAPKKYSSQLREWIGLCCKPDLRYRPLAQNIVRSLLQHQQIRKYAR